jgi:hypothetical protein
MWVRAVWPWFCGTCIGLAAAVAAHDLSQSESTVDIRGRDARVVLRVDVTGLGVPSQDDAVSYDVLDREIERIYAVVKLNWQLTSAAPIERTELEAYDLEEGHVLRMTLAIQFAGAPRSVTVRSTFDSAIRPDHRHRVSVRFADGPASEAMLDARLREARFEGDASMSQRVMWGVVVIALVVGPVVYRVVERAFPRRAA